MPKYSWICEDCKKETEVERKMSEYTVPPEDGCESCGSKKLNRTISAGTNFNLEGSGWYRDGY